MITFSRDDQPDELLARTHCPRCGYDQRGTMESWREQCPLEGRCTECGLDFEWRELLNPRLTIPRWFVEAGGSLRLFMRQCLSTFLRSFKPWMFWSSVRMSNPRNVRRAVLYGVVCLAMLYLCFAVSHGLLMWGVWRDGASSGAASTGGWPVFLQAAVLPLSDRSLGQFTWGGAGMPYLTPAAAVTYWSDNAGTLLLTFAIQATCGIAFALLPVSRRRAQVKWSHIIRVTAYGSCWCCRRLSHQCSQQVSALEW